MKAFFSKVKNWLVAHKPTKRRLIQVYAALLYNANIKGFATGKIYTGVTKNLCVPGLNCYSCPGAVGACPLGALQDSLAQSGTTVPAYIFGILILFGLLLGRLICGFLCPFGLIQELLYKIRTPKLKKSRFTRILSYFKYVLLVIIIAIPIIYAGIPSFCKYVCPAGTLEGAVSLLANIGNSDFYGMLGYLFSWKFCVLVVVIVASIFIYRFFCRFICPLGAIYGLFCKISLLGVKLDKDKCIDCGLCIQSCKMDIRHVGDHECIQCGECIPVCPVQAISWKGSKIFLKNTTPLAQPAAAETEKIPLLELARNNAGKTVEDEEQRPVELATEQSTVEEPVTVEEATEPAPAEAEAQSSEQNGEGNETPDEVKEEKKKGFGECVKSAFKKPRFVVEFVAWVLAIALLVTALVCYNLPEKVEDSAPDFTVTTYKSAAAESGESYKLKDGGKKIKVVYFWRTDFAESVEGIARLNEYEQSCPYDVDFVALHSVYKDGRDVQSFINDKGWDTYGLIFAQDSNASNAFSAYGGDISVPKAITAVVAADGQLIYKGDSLPDGQALTKAIQDAQKCVVYRVGDLCPVFELDCYNPEDGRKFSTAETLGKVTVINFWYTTCDPCKDELPEFEKVYASYGGEINMVAIHSFTAVPKEGVQNFLDTASDKNGKPWNSYTLTFAQDTVNAKVATMLGGKGSYPFTVVVDASGKITFVKQGKCSESELDGAIKAAMQG